MISEQQQQILDRLLDQKAAGTTYMVDADRQQPTDVYVSPVLFAREWQRFFLGLPQILAASGDVATPGDFLTVELCGISVLLSRDGTGAVHGFVNACPHRGARLVSAAKGGGHPSFVCPYHGWVFDSGGRCCHIPQGECFSSFQAAGKGLIPLPVQEWAGLVWGVLDPQGAIDVEGFLGELGPDLAALELGGSVAFRPYERPFAGNWKVYIENFLESYHVDYAHSSLITGVRGDGILVDRFGVHQRFIGPRHTIDALRGVDRSRWRFRPCTFTTYFLFPATSLTVEPDHVIWQRFYPTGVQGGQIVQTMLIPATTQADWWQSTWARCQARDVQALEEDMAFVQTIGTNLATGWLPRIVFGRREGALMAFHEAVAQELA